MIPTHSQQNEWKHDMILGSLKVSRQIEQVIWGFSRKTPLSVFDKIAWKKQPEKAIVKR